MFYLLYFAIFAVANTALTENTDSSRSKWACSVDDPSPQLMATHQKLSIQSTMDRREVGQLINVDTYVHIFAHNETYQGGWLNDTIIRKQMQVLNHSFAGSNIRFTLQATERSVTTPPTFGGLPGPLTAFYAQHRRGDYRSLNIYYDPGMYGGACSFPGMTGALDKFSSEFILDGCRVASDTTPGGKDPFGSGKTTVHEVGHWMGLLHTFKGGCNATHGDFIDDTAPEAEGVAGSIGDCPASRDSCPHTLGHDNIHNYMSYSSDDCRWEFTRGQTDRMRQIWNLIRLAW